MIVVLLILIGIVLSILRFRHRSNDISFWQDLVKVVTLKVVDYFCKGTPTKIVMLFLKSSCCLYGGMSLTYPVIRAGIECDENNSFGKLFLEFQWDSIGSTSSYLFLICNTIVVILYFWRYRGDDVAAAVNKILHKAGNIEKQNEELLSNDQVMLDKLNLIASQISCSSFSIKQLLPKLKESIDELKVDTATKYLDTIWNESQVHHKKDFSLQASILYLQGECARLAKGKDSKGYHFRAYDYMKKAEESDGQILQGVILEACKSRDFENAEVYAKELQKIDSHNYWCYVPLLMQADSLSEVKKSIPSGVDAERALATCVMLGGGRDKGDLGVELSNYRYHSLSSITIDNFALWILDLSVATTRFCQSFMIQRNIKDMYTTQCKELFELLDEFLNCLAKTEIENPLPDTMFLHAGTGYIGNQDMSWIDAFATANPTSGMEELYHLIYAIILNDIGQYDKAKEILSKYKGDTLASILNLRFVLAIRNNDLSECVEIFKNACDRSVVIPDHLANYFFATVNSFYDSIRDCADRLVFESEIATESYGTFLRFKAGDKIAPEPIIGRKGEYPPSISPYVAIVLKENEQLRDAIEILETTVDRRVLDLRTSLLIEYYQIDKSYSQKLYHLLKDLRLARQMDLNTLSLELSISNQIGDNENCLAITSEIVNIAKDDVNAWVNHVQSLYRCEGHVKEISELKPRFKNASLSPSATILLFKIYHAVNETQFALDLLYNQIIRTQDQSLKDFFISIHVSPSIDALISSEKRVVELDDFVTLFYDGKEKEITVSKSSVYEDLVGCEVEDKKNITIKESVEVEIKHIHTKYYKLLRDIFKELSESQSSKSVKMFSTDDFDFANDPIGALRKMAGKTDDVIAQEKALLGQYKKGEMSLLNFINDHDGVSDSYEKIFGQKFEVCSLPVKFYQQLLGEDDSWKQKIIVLDLTSLVSLYEFDRKYGLSYDKLFSLPKSVTLLIKEQLINEEKGMPKFLSHGIVEKVGYEIIDETKTVLWNKLKSLEAWIGKHCNVETVEEAINIDISKRDSELWRMEMDSLLLTQKGMLLLTEDWCFAKRFLRVFPSLSTFQWLSLMGFDDAENWGYFMLECGNVGYPMTPEYMQSQYELMSSNKPNNYQTCLDNVKYNPETIEVGIAVARGLIVGIVDSTKVVGATNMLSMLFSAVNQEICMLLCQREFITYKDRLWNQCLMDALKISHPLIMPK